MKKHLFRFTLYVIIVYLTCGMFNPVVAATRPFGENGTHFCGVIDNQSNKQISDQFPNRHYARSFVSNLNVGEPRTVRLIYFLPNDRPYRAGVVQKMKDTIRTVQTFYAEQMEAHGYGRTTFRVETDPQGEPIVHRVDGQHPDSHYLDNTPGPVLDEVKEALDLNSIVYLIVVDNSIDRIGRSDAPFVLGIGGGSVKKGGFAVVSGRFDISLVAHELGHAFGLLHDFHDGAYIMSYGLRESIGPPRSQLSACHAEYLSVHPYFNPDTPTEEREPPIVELISPHLYPAGSQSVTIRLKVNDSEGLHQVVLFSHNVVNACRGLAGARDALVEFKYDGFFRYDYRRLFYTSLSSSDTHSMHIEAIDTDGNVSKMFFTLTESSPHHIATLEGHTSSVNSVAFSPVDATLLATGSSDGTVKLWDVMTQQNIATFKGHTAGVTSVSFSSDGTVLASGSWDRTVKLWNMVTQQNIATFKGHTTGIDSVSFSSDKRRLATGSSDETVKLWDVMTQQDIATFKGHTARIASVSFSSDGTVLASGSSDRTVKLWDVVSQQDIAIFKGHTAGVTSVSFSSDGTVLASGSSDRTVKLWDVVSQQDIAIFKGHKMGVTSVSFSSDGTVLASGSRARTVKLWDISTRLNFATLGHEDRVTSVSFSSDNTTLASGTEGNTVELWDMSRLTGAYLEATAEIDIPDPNLRAAIAEAIGMPPDTPIFRGHLTTLFILDARTAKISDLTGLEYATNLTQLDLYNNSISDISAVSGLTNLRKLDLYNNSISDISAVSGLTNLRKLDLYNNSISDISAVSGLTNLRKLDLYSNSISDISAVSGLTNLRELNLKDNSIWDISAVSGLTNLRELNLGGNFISHIWAVVDLANLRELNFWNNLIWDISAISGLTNLEFLHLGDNVISDISAVSGLANLIELNLEGNFISDLSAVSGLTNLTLLRLLGNKISDVSPLLGLNLIRESWDNTGLYLWGNPLSYASINTHIPAIQAKGIGVKFNNQAHPALLKISGDDQTGASFAALSQPFVVEAQDANGSVLAGVLVKFIVTKGGGTLSTTITRTDQNGRAQSMLRLGANLGANTVEVSAAGIESWATFYAIADTESPQSIADVNGDESINVLDLVVIASELGNAAGTNLVVDVNRDGVVSILDLVLAAGMFDAAAAAPSAQPQVPETLTAVEVHGWLADARSLEAKDSIMRRGFLVLEQLLVSLTPTEAELLANYPNPFNPETWIPYRLAEAAFVTLTIYDLSGQVVRTLEVGHRTAAAYENQSKAIYWDGRNQLGESVASGLYFYTLTAGEFSATRRMLILK